MKLAKLTASTAALLLSSTALIAQESQTRTFENVYVDVEGSAVLIPVELALEACGLDEAGIQQAATSRLDTSGLDADSIFAQINEATPMGSMGGDAAAMNTQDTAAAGGTAGDASSGTMDPATADASGTGATGDAGAMGSDTATADAAAGTEAAGAAGTTQTADANMTTDAGNATTDMGNQAAGTDTTATADAGATGDQSGTGMETTDTSIADAAGQEVPPVGVDAVPEVADADAAALSGEEIEAGVQNVESTAAETNTTVTNAQGTADPTTTVPGEEYLALAVCQIDVVRASELGIPNIANETVTE